jgi:raffinose/stachyose/melibiose transport system permease protein
MGVEMVERARVGKAPKRGTAYQREYSLCAVVFLLPMIFFLVVFVVWPILSSAQTSLFEWNGVSPTRQYVGFQNWSRLIGDRVFWNAFRNNLTVLVLSIVIQIPMGMALAVLVSKGGRWMVVFKTVCFLPMLMSSVAIGILFKYVYDPYFGVLTASLKAVGLSPLVRNWLGDPQIALYSVIAVVCWQFIPFYMILFEAGIAGIPVELHEAAIIDGATENQYFWRITLPLLWGTTRAAVSLALFGSLTYFDLVWVMTTGGPSGATELMATYMVKKAFLSTEVGYGSTVAFAMFLIVVLISGIGFLLTRRKESSP